MATPVYMDMKKPLTVSTSNEVPEQHPHIKHYRLINAPPLASVFIQGQVKCVAALLARGADIRHRGPSGQTALHFAACGGGALVARTLVAAGADPAAFDDAGNTSVDVARLLFRPNSIRLVVITTNDVFRGICTSARTSSKKMGG